MGKKWAKTYTCCICESTKETYIYKKDNAPEYVGKPICARHRQMLWKYGKVHRTWKDKNAYRIENGYAIMCINKVENIEIKIDIEFVEEFSNLWFTVNAHGIISGSEFKGKIRKLYSMILNTRYTNVIHLNGDKYDYRKDNLKPLMICQKPNKSNTSGIIGVCYSNTLKTWIIGFNGKNNKYSKDFKTAVKKRLQLELEEYGEFAPQKHLFEQYGII